MLNAIWMGLILAGFLVAAAHGHVGAVTTAATEAAKAAIETAIHLAGVMALWLGLTRIAEESGLMQAFTRLISPVTRLLFPSVPRDHPAMGAMAMNVSANLLGLGNAATPLGLKAMQELKKLAPPDSDEATPAMITFMILNTSSPTIIPGTLIALRAAHGSANPADIVLPTFLATVVAGATGLLVDAWYRRRYAGKKG